MTTCQHDMSRWWFLTEKQKQERKRKRKASSRSKSQKHGTDTAVPRPSHIPTLEDLTAQCPALVYFARQSRRAVSLGGARQDKLDKLVLRALV